MYHYEIVQTVGQLKRLADKMMKIEEFAFDTETNTLQVLGDNEDFVLVGISISWGQYNNYYIPLGHRRYEDALNQLPQHVVVEHLRHPFMREDVTITGRNLKFDMHTLARVGIVIKTKLLIDTMIISWLCDENSPNGLKEDTAKFLKIKQTKFQDVMSTVTTEIKKEYGLKGNNKATFDLTLIEDGAPYAVADSFYSWELYLGFLDLVVKEKMDKIYERVYMPFIRTLFEMEERGVSVDLDKLHKMRKEVAVDMEQLEYDMFELARVEFNPNSGQQVAELLFGFDKGDKANDHILKNSFNFPVVSETPTGAPQTSADVLIYLSLQKYKVKRKQEGVEFCKLLVTYKKLSKLSSAFIDGLEKQMYNDKKVHPSFNIIGTDSGRLSCSQPNLQQLPKADEEDKYQIRSLFIGSVDPLTNERNKIVALDFSNLEMRVLAHFSRDKNLLDMFEHNHDTHSSTAVNVFELDCTPAQVKTDYPHLRQSAKTINFMLMYGGGAYTLYNNLKSDNYNPIDLGAKSYLEQYKVKRGEDVAQIYIDRYFNSYSGVAKFIKDQKRFAKRNEYVLTVLKRKRRLPDINSHDFKQVSYCERLSVNSCVQGSAADITMSAQNRINADEWFNKNGVYMIVQVHDELVFECPEKHIEKAIEKIKHYMEHPFGDNVKLNLPLVADSGFGDTYQEAK